MRKYWGWVERTSNGGFIANDYAEGQVVDDLPEEVMEVVALLDLLPLGTQLNGGSRRRNAGNMHKEYKTVTYFITHEDLKPQEEE